MALLKLTTTPKRRRLPPLHPLTHQHAALSREVREHLLLEGGLVHVARPNRRADGEGPLLRLAASVLIGVGESGG